MSKIRLNEAMLHKIIKESVKKVLEKEDEQIQNLNAKFKHVEIQRHPIKDCFMVFNKTYPMIPPYFGTLKQCIKAAISAEKHSEELKNKE